MLSPKQAIATYVNGAAGSNRSIGRSAIVCVLCLRCLHITHMNISEATNLDMPIILNLLHLMVLIVKLLSWCSAFSR